MIDENNSSCQFLAILVTSIYIIQENNYINQIAISLNPNCKKQNVSTNRKFWDAIVSGS